MTLVLLPGMDGTGTLFAPFVAALDPSIKVRVVSYPTDEPLGYAALEGLAKAALPEHGPFVVLGESFSGPLAVMLAAAGHERLKGLVLCCTFVRNPRPAGRVLRPLAAWLPVGLAPDRALGWALLGRFANDALRTLLAQAVGQVALATLRARLLAVLDVDVSSQLKAMQVPCLYLRALQDRLVPAGAAALIVQLRPETEVVAIDGPHCLLQAVPEQTALAVAAFVRSVQGAAAPDAVRA